jgi:hypothetical protein
MRKRIEHSGRERGELVHETARKVAEGFRAGRRCACGARAAVAQSSSGGPTFSRTACDARRGRHPSSRGVPLAVCYARLRLNAMD